MMSVRKDGMYVRCIDARGWKDCYWIDCGRNEEFQGARGIPSSLSSDKSNSELSSWSARFALCSQSRFSISLEFDEAIKYWISRKQTTKPDKASFDEGAHLTTTTTGYAKSWAHTRTRTCPPAPALAKSTSRTRRILLKCKQLHWGMGILIWFFGGKKGSQDYMLNHRAQRDPGSPVFMNAQHVHSLSHESITDRVTVVNQHEWAFPGRWKWERQEKRTTA